MTTTPPINGTATSAELTLVRRFVAEVLNQGRFEALTELVHPDYRYHGPDGSEIAGREGLRQLITGFRIAFPDLNARITTEIRDGDHVAATLVLTGTHLGDFDGLAPTGRHLELPVAIVTRIADHRIVEDREYYDTATIVSQLIGEAR